MQQNEDTKVFHAFRDESMNLQYYATANLIKLNQIMNYALESANYLIFTPK